MAARELAQRGSQEFDFGPSRRASLVEVDNVPAGMQPLSGSNNSRRNLRTTHQSSGRRNLRTTHHSPRFRPDASRENMDAILLGTSVHVGESRIWSDYGDLSRTNTGEVNNTSGSEDNRSMRERVFSNELWTRIATPVHSQSPERMRRELIVSRIENLS